MAIVYQIPVPVDSNVSQRVQLDGTTYTFRWLWNARDDHWFLNLYDVEGTAVVEGLRVVTGWDILKDVTKENRPTGRLAFFDEATSSTTVYGDDAGEDDLGVRVFCYYIPEGTV